MGIEPNNDSLAEMLEGTRDALEKALIKIAKLKLEKADLANKVLVYAHRAETAQSLLQRIAACEGGSWNVERHSKERSSLLEEAHALLAKQKAALTQR